jgi:threonylcarbamoyladenosine tRNA methylthiotransferase MtaB
MPQVGRDIVKDRARRLREQGDAALRRHLDAQVGATRRVLVESRKLGRTGHFTQVRLAAPLDPGPIVDLTLVGHDGRRLLAA